MALECPNCRERVSFLRSIRTTAWGRFPCKTCGSILSIDVKRRLLAIIPWVAALWLLYSAVRINRYGPLVFIPVLVAVFIFIFYLLEHVVLIDRRAFCCRTCGYDLQGQTEPRCPECGSPFDPSEKQRILARVGQPPPRARHRWILIVLILLLSATLIANVLTYLAARRPAAVPGPAQRAATQPAVSRTASSSMADSAE